MAISANPFKAACVQLCSGIDPVKNLPVTEDLIRQAATDGATYIQTPEMTNVVQKNRAGMFAVVESEDEDLSLKRFRALAAELKIHLHIGSLAIRTGEETIANRAFVIAPDGTTLARYDKIHMYDVDLEGGESYRESAVYSPGDKAVVCDLPEIRLGVAICYDVRFAYLYRALAKAGAGLMSAPAAFTKKTGMAHWHILQRARAIETGSFMMSAAQAGLHEDGRETFGHSLIVAPWGEVQAEGDEAPGFITAEIDPAKVDQARSAVPTLKHDRDFRVEDNSLIAGAAQ